MSLRNIPLWAGRFPTPFLLRQWTAKAAAEPLRIIPYLTPDKAAEPHFRVLWAKAFPARQPLPEGPLSTPEGRGTDAFWSVFG